MSRLRTLQSEADIQAFVDGLFRRWPALVDDALNIAAAALSRLIPLYALRDPPAISLIKRAGLGSTFALPSASEAEAPAKAAEREKPQHP
jgi:hypothetical protein